MRDYAKVSPRFWLGETGRELRKAGAEAQVVAFYLMTSPHANMLGLYYLPVLYLAHETGLGLEGASKGLKRAVEAGFCSYDHDAEMVWVHEMAAWQVGETLKPGDNRCAGVRNEYASLPENAFLSVFYDRYKTDFHLDVRRNNSRNSVRGFEGAFKGLRSQEQEQEQEKEQEQDKNTMVHGKKNTTNQAGDVQTVNPGQPAGTTPEADRVVPESTGQSVGRVDYPDVFEQVWREYPLRAGANPKKSAFSAWKARLREGVPPETMLDGVRRYARYLAATGKAGTEFVQRATTFFGPDRNFENPWLLPVSGTNNQRCVNHISEPDTEIPPGFRG
ncbi:DNA-binding protein [Escherichia coli]|nr:DNA-binding protein [Escherichia coli]EEU2403741.1 DNA-binding protein [Escherichia coli]EFA3009146.1 DNA-binding protein [Escherichia coli]